MIIINKIINLFKNIRYIYGESYQKKKLVITVISSIFLMPIYVMCISILSLISIAILFFYLPFYLINIILRDTNGMDDPLMGIVALPLSIGYYGLYLGTFIPYILIAFLCDLIAEIISRNHHHEEYVIIWPSVFAVPHKEYYL